MKFLTLILGLYLLGLSFVPCGDRRECKEKSSTSVAAPQSHDRHANDTENCPPLCHCACCSISVCYQPIIEIEAPVPSFPAIEYTSLDISYSSHSRLSIWQPPRTA